ncbi:MAG: hypothetical protein HQM13_04890 [SAR324 cluster bacterium]|nr:hypothetical protein [SAR324 cluster bacterium]
MRLKAERNTGSAIALILTGMIIGCSDAELSKNIFPEETNISGTLDQSAPVLKRGSLYYSSTASKYNCVSCHGNNGTGNSNPFGPDLTQSKQSGQQLESTLQRMWTSEAYNNMPTPLDEQQLLDLSDYILFLKSESANPTSTTLDTAGITSNVETTIVTVSNSSETGNASCNRSLSDSDLGDDEDNNESHYDDGDDQIYADEENDSEYESDVNDDDESHHSGEDCMSCHQLGSSGNDEIFSVAGTVYDALDGKKVLAGVSIGVLDYSGKLQTQLTSDSKGNFYSKRPLSTPYMIIMSYQNVEMSMIAKPSNGSCNECHNSEDSSPSRVWISSQICP